MKRIMKYNLIMEKIISEKKNDNEEYRGMERDKEEMVDVDK
jgi:hypothetical protein